MRTRFQKILLICILISLIFILPKQRSTAEARKEYSSHQQVFFPVIGNYYYLEDVSEWTPWAFQGQYIRNMTVGPVDGSIWSITSEGTFRSTC